MKQKSSCPAKVTRPQLSRYYSRDRVFELLDGFCEYPVILITGPAGCGKTTLVNSYLKERKMRCLWYQVDEGDADPATFFYYMRLAASRINPTSRKLLPLLTPEYQPGLATFTMRYFEQLYKRMPRQSVIVFDNYQEAARSSPFHMLIKYGLSEIPRGMHVIIISRTAPPAELVRLEANRQMRTLGWNLLKLQPEETAGIVKLLASGSLPEKRIKEIHDLVAGWMAGVVLMVQKAIIEDVEPQVFAPEAIFDYFASEVFSKMDDSTRDFLLKTVCLPRMSPSLAGELTGNTNAGWILSELSRHNYFVERRFSDEPVYSYHPLFRTFLISEAKKALPPKSMLQLITKAASLLEKDGQVDEALDLIVKAGDWEKLVVFLMQHAPSMLEQGRHRSLEHWLTGIPENILHDSPWLLFWLGASRFPFDPLQGRGNFEEAYAGFKDQDDITGIFLAWSGLVNTIMLGNVGYAKLDELIIDLEERREAFDALPSDEIRARVASGMFSILAYSHPEYPDAGLWGELALDLTRRAGDTDAFILTMVNRTAFQLLSSGNLKQMGEDIRSLQQLADDPLISELGRLYIHTAEANYYAVTVMHEQCIRAVEKGLELAQVSGIRVWDIFLLGKAAMSCQNVRDYGKAAHYLDLLSSYEDEPRPWLQGFVQILKARQALINKDLANAVHFAQRVMQLNAEAAIPITLCCDLIFNAQLMHKLGDENKADACLHEAVAIAGNIRSEIVLISAKFIEAQIAFDQGDENRALSNLKESLTRQREIGYFLITCDLPDVTAVLCARALEADIEVEFVKEIIRRRRLIPEDITMTPKGWPWPVKVFTLGRFAVVKDGQELIFSRKTQKKPLEMLKTMTLRGCFPMSETNMADILWPDADGDLALQSCATTLHRLRKLLGHHDAILLQNGLLMINSRICWIDAWIFEKLLDKSDLLWQSESVEAQRMKACKLTCMAMDLYQGGFLAEENWNTDAISMNEHLHDRYFKALYKLGDHLVLNNELHKALGFYEHGLEIDDCAEECCRRLMVCLQRLERRAEGMKVFERCSRALQARLGVEPSPDTVALCRSLQAH